MKKRRKRMKLRLLVQTVLCVLLAAFPLQTFAGGSVSGADGSYTVSCSGLSPGGFYSVTAVRGTLEDYVLNDSSILYTTQFQAAAGTRDVTVAAGKEITAVVLLAGQIDGVVSPEIIGLIEDGKVSDHRYTVTYKEPSCTEEGYRKYVCSHCQDTVIRDVKAALGHDYRISGRTDATEESDGSVEYRCDRCGDSYREVLPREAVWDCPFRDVSKKAWYYPGVKYAYKNSLFRGVAEDSFGPDSSMTRAMLVTVLYRMEGSPAAEAAGEGFTDVVSGSWYEAGVIWASSCGVVNGMGDGSFAPDRSVTREQMAAILCRYAALKGVDTSKRTDLSSFTDWRSVSSWAGETLSWACAEGIISGSASGQGPLLLPSGNATRGQVATVLMRYQRNIL